MYKLFFILCIATLLGAIETSEKLFECSEIFKERKSELLVELERIDEQKQALSALKSATEELLKQKEAKLNLQEAEIDKKLQETTLKEQNIKTMLEQNEAVLKKLRETKSTKTSETFAKMKPAVAASILSDMNQSDAVEILNALKPKSVGQILSKMDSKKAQSLQQS